MHDAGMFAVYAWMRYAVGMEILGIIACAVGASFCFIIAGAVATEPIPADNAHEMYNLIGITPENAHLYMV